MTNSPIPTDAEMKLLRCLWAHGQRSARELHDAVAQKTDWSFSTTRKTLDRMTEKGLVAVDIVHGVKAYRALAPRLLTLSRMIRHFTRHVLDADGPLPAATFVHSRMIEPEDIEELERLLNDPDGEETP